MILDAVQFIVYYRTASANAALKALKSAEARKTAVALRLRRRRRTLLYDIVERAQYMELIGIDRKTSVELLASEFRFRLEEEMRRAKNLFNFVVYSAAMTVFAAIVVGVLLGILSPVGAQMAALLVALAALPLAAVEAFMPPVRKWDYWLAVLFAAPAFAAYAAPHAAFATVPAAVIYALWYYVPKYLEASEEFRLAARGRLIAASGDVSLARQAFEVMRAVRASGAYDLQAAAEYMLRLAEHHYASLRREGLMRALVAASLVAIAAAAVGWLYPQLAEMAAQAQGGPLQLYLESPRPMLWVLSLASAVVAARLTESYAALPLYTPLTLSALAV